MKGILSVLSVLLQLTLLAQSNLSIKAGLEMDYKDFDELHVNSNNRNYHFTNGEAFSSILSLQIGGRFGTDQLFEGGIGLGFGSMYFGYTNGKGLKSETFRKGIYMEAYTNSSGCFEMGIGSQLYTYKMSLDRSFDENYNFGKETGSCTWKAYGIAWKFLARVYFGEDERHSLQGFVGAGGEFFKVSEFKVDNSKVEFSEGANGMTVVHMGISYARVFNRR